MMIAVEGDSSGREIDDPFTTITIIADRTMTGLNAVEIGVK